MPKNSTLPAAYTDTKPHYPLLDGLRGAAALMVVWYHIFEGFAFARGGAIETFNHGYLAVDFFFLLSGFVISYAYDDRWAGPMTLRDFFTRRLIRLHPLIVWGALLGTIAFLLQGSVKWDGSPTPPAALLLALALSCLLIPAWPGAAHEVRGNGEMYPLNGPCWSLLFEYIGNLLYALLLRRLSARWLLGVTALSGGLWAWMALSNFSGYESMGIGWTLDKVNFWGGLARMTFPFSLGMLMARHFRPVRVRGIFGPSVAVLFALFSVPFLPSTGALCVNGLYEFLCVSLAFPLLLWLGASGQATGGSSTALCRFLGDLSYPLYIVHYPVMYLFYAWLIAGNRHTLAQTWPVVAGVYALCVILAYVSLRTYDLPLRRHLARRFQAGSKKRNPQETPLQPSTKRSKPS